MSLHPIDLIAATKRPSAQDFLFLLPFLSSIAFLQTPSPVSFQALCYLGLRTGVPRTVLNAEPFRRSVIVVFLAKAYPIVAAISTTLLVHSGDLLC